MSLRIPIRKMLHEALAVRTWRVGFRRILGLGTSEGCLPVFALGQFIGVIHRVAALMPQQFLAPFRRAALDFHHQMHLESLETRMRQIKWDGNGGNAVRRKPFVGQVAIGTKCHAARSQIVDELVDARFELAALQADA